MEKNNFISMISACLAIYFWTDFLIGANHQINYDDEHYSNVYLGHIFSSSRTAVVCAALLTTLLAILFYKRSSQTRPAKKD